MRLGLGEQRKLQRLHPVLRPFAGFAHPEAEIGRHLVVARARGVQPPGGRADQLGQPLLDVKVNVLEFTFEGEAALVDLAADRVQTLEDGRAIGGGNDALGRQHRGMGGRAPEVFPRQALVEIDGDVYRLHDPGGAASEAPAPHLVRAHGRCR